MKRILFNCLGFLVLLLLMLASVMWWRSYRSLNPWARAEIGSHNWEWVVGSLHYEVLAPSPDPQDAGTTTGWKYRRVDASSQDPLFWGRFEVIEFPGSSLDVWVPSGLIWLTCAIPAACWLVCIRFRRRERRLTRQGLCVDCGYDLRASGECCPECGRPTRQPPGRWWRSRAMRVPLLMAVVVLCSPLYLVYQQMAFLRLQARCMNYTAPADRVVFDDDPTVAARLIAGGGYRPVWEVASPARGGTIGWRKVAGFTVPVLEEIRKEGVNPGTDDTVVFMHARRSPDGSERVVVGQVGIQDPKKCLWLSFATLTPVGSGLGSRPIASDAGSLILTLVQTSRFRLFMGQSDPSDPSRFTIPYEIDGQRGTFEGQLNDSGYVLLKPGPGPGRWNQYHGEWIWQPPPRL